jgi:biopolymer transport protein ExbD
MITSTLVSPNALKVNLPQSKKQTTVQGKASVTIDSLQHIYASTDGKEEVEVTLDELGAKLSSQKVDSVDMVVSLYADQSVPYKMIVDVLNVANDNDFKMVLATRPPERSSDVSDDMVENDLDVSSEDASVSNTEGATDAGASE